MTGLTDSHQALTLACDNGGILYTVDATTGDLYTLDKATAVASFVGETGFEPRLQQTMAVDHETDKLYWAAYQGYDGDNRFLELNKQTGEVVSSTKMEYNSQLSSLYKPYEADSTLVPDDVAPTGLSLTPNRVTLKAGDTGSLRCMPRPTTPSWIRRRLPGAPAIPPSPLYRTEPLQLQVPALPPLRQPVAT